MKKNVTNNENKNMIYWCSFYCTEGNKQREMWSYSEKNKHNKFFRIILQHFDPKLVMEMEWFRKWTEVQSFSRFWPFLND